MQPISVHLHPTRPALHLIPKHRELHALRARRDLQTRVGAQLGGRDLRKVLWKREPVPDALFNFGDDGVAVVGRDCAA